MMSFSITCGVANMTFELLYMSPLFAGATFPVSISNCFVSICSGSIRSEKLLRCCSTSGLVGAIMRAFLFLSLFILCATMPSAMIVLPMPVGRTTSEFFFAHVAIMFSWYLLRSIVSFFNRGWLRYSGMFNLC